MLLSCDHKIIIFKNSQYWVKLSVLINKHQSPVKPRLSDPLGGVTSQITEGSDNRRAKITGLNEDGRLGLRLDN